MIEVTINKCTDNLSSEGLAILKENVEKTDKLLITKANDSIIKNRKTVTNIAKPVNCKDKIYYIRFTISIRKAGKTPISYRINDSYDSTVVYFDTEFETMQEVKNYIEYVESNLGKIL